MVFSSCRNCYFKNMCIQKQDKFINWIDCSGQNIHWWASLNYSYCQSRRRSGTMSVLVENIVLVEKPGLCVLDRVEPEVPDEFLGGQLHWVAWNITLPKQIKMKLILEKKISLPWGLAATAAARARRRRASFADMFFIPDYWFLDEVWKVTELTRSAHTYIMAAIARRFSRGDSGNRW